MKDKKEMAKKTISKPKEKIKKQDKELYWVLGVMVGLIAIFLVSSAVMQSFDSVKHEGLTFTKEQLGDIPLFKYYYFTDTTPATGRAIEGAQPRPVTVYLRNDPRENPVPVEGEISLIGGRKVYISISEGLEGCQYGSIAVAGLSSFFSQNGFALEGALTDEEEAEKNNLKHVTCENKPRNPVIIIQSGEETSVKAVNENCYEITSNSCEILFATEKFIVQSIIDAREAQASEEPI